MRSLILATATAIATLPLLTHAAVGSACSVSGTPGVCLATATCTSGSGTTHTGFCPNDPAGVKCCTKSCSSGGHCRPVSSCTSGTTLSGLCPGDSTIKCCIPAGGCAAPNVNAATISLIKEFEGFVASPEPDPVGLPTVGYGHRCTTTNCAEVPYRFPLTTTTASALLTSDLRTFQDCIARDIADRVRLNANQYGALVSWAFNVGCNASKSSRLVRRLNNGENPNTVAQEELPTWNKGGGKVLPGLVRRRAAEVTLFKRASSVIAHPSPCSPLFSDVRVGGM